jgi:hypothetical protein
LSSFSVSPASAQDEDADFIISGKPTAATVNKSGYPPDNYYTSSPPIMAAKRIGSGAVVAAGIVAGCRDGNWNDPANPYPHLDALLDVIFQWMVPGADNLIWYGGHEVYNNAYRCPQLIEVLKDNFGYRVKDERKDPFESRWLTYDILVIPQLQEGSPDLLEDDEVELIRSFVENGGGLLVMEQSDFSGHQFPTIQNKILNGLGFTDTYTFPYIFQDDQVEDNVNHWGGAHPDNYFKVIAEVDPTTEIGAAYENATGVTEIGLYSVCSLAVAPPPPDYEVILGSPSGTKLGSSGDTMTFTVTVKNTGLNPDTYTVTMEETLGWSPSISQSAFSLENRETGEFEVEVTIPESVENMENKVWDEILLKAVGASGAEDNMIIRASACVPRENLPYPKVQFLPGEIYFWFSVCTLRIESPAVPIMCGTETGYSEELTAREPWPALYCAGEYPPMGAAEFVGEGRVIAHSGLGIFRSLPVPQFPDERLAGKKLAPLMARWLIDWENPENHNFLFYWSAGAFHSAERLYEWLDMAENELGFDVDTQEGGTITSELLADYDVLFISGLELPLLSGELQAIADWVENGGGLFLMEQADYQAQSNPLNTNAVLESVGCHMRFNDDEVYDNDSWTKDGPWFPECYLLDPREENSEFDVWFPENAMHITLDPLVRSACDNAVDYTLTIMNIGTGATTYTIEVEETTALGWEVNVGLSEIQISSGENAEVTITVTVPYIEENVITKADFSVTVEAKGLPFIKDSEDFRALGDPELCGERPGPGVSVAVIAAAIVAIIAVIGTAAPLYMRRRRLKKVRKRRRRKRRR